MNTPHLKEEQVQQFALDPSDCEAAIHVHVQSCEACKAKVTAYQVLFTGIKAGDSPAFDFDLSEAVMTKLSPIPEKRSSDKVFFLLFAIISSLLMGAALFLFGENLRTLFVSIGPWMLYVLLISAVTIFIAVSVALFKNYQKKWTALDVYDLQH